MISPMEVAAMLVVFPVGFLVGVLIAIGLWKVVLYG